MTAAHELHELDSNLDSIFDKYQVQDMFIFISQEQKKNSK